MFEGGDSSHVVTIDLAVLSMPLETVMTWVRKPGTAWFLLTASLAWRSNFRTDNSSFAHTACRVTQSVHGREGSMDRERYQLTSEGKAINSVCRMIVFYCFRLP